MKTTRLKLLHVRIGEPNAIKFQIAGTDLARARNFIETKNEREKKTGEPVWIDAELRFWYPERTPAQNRFYWRFVEALAQEARETRGGMHEILKAAFLEHEPVMRKKLVKQAGRTWELIEFADSEPVSSATLSTVEFAAYCEKVIGLCADQGLPIYSAYVEWQEWLEKNQWPLSETYRTVDEYRVRHPVCEFCGKDTKWEDGRYVRGGGEVMHIVSKGAGGPDSGWNLIHGCTDCHRLGGESQHVAGWGPLLEQYPQMRKRIEYAHRKMGAERGEKR